jgi:hypothetical protein
MPVTSSPDSIRREIAGLAARLVADAGLDYGAAKRKAAREITGRSRPPASALPDNDLIDEALAEHLALFDSEHEARVRRRREAAASLMKWLEPFDPYLTGAVWKGIVAEHAPIHVQVFHDNAKEVGIALLNHRVRYEATTMAHLRDDSEVETLAFYWQDEPVLLSLYLRDDLRGALRPSGARGAERGNREALLARMAEAGREAPPQSTNAADASPEGRPRGQRP